jgi:hypothetical protein
MTKLPLGLALLLAASFAVEGCASKPAVAVAPPPASDFPVKPAETKSDAVAERPPGWSATQVTASARYVRISRAMPEAKGALAFLADEAALRAGTLTLTKAQADEALVELTRLTKQDVWSTPTVTVAEGNRARISITSGIGEVAPLEINGQVFTPKPDVTLDVDVFSPKNSAGLLHLGIEVVVTTLDRFVEYYAKPVEVTDATGAQLVKVPTGVYQPLFSTNSTKAEGRFAPGSVVVLRADRQKVRGVIDAVTKGESETILVFLTDSVSPAKRAN